jgi:hypothetical protein
VPPPRYSSLPLPASRYLPGRGPRPAREAEGSGVAGAVDPEAWASCALYLHAVDLYNHALFWESHEAFELLWRAAADPAARAFLQGLIQVCAAEVHRAKGARADALHARAIARLRGVPGRFMGLDVARFVEESEARRRDARADPAWIELAIDAAGERGRRTR